MGNGELKIENVEIEVKIEIKVEIENQSGMIIIVKCSIFNSPFPIYFTSICSNL
jgi:hypothetical protein